MIRFELWLVLSIIVVAQPNLLGQNCGGSVELRRGKVERIEPPRDPNGNYRPNLQCHWRIHSQARAFWVTFDRIDVESWVLERSRHWHEYDSDEVQACSNDYVKIEFMSWTDEIHKTMCGASNGPRSFLIHSNDASIYFKTDNSGAGYGFVARVTPCQDMSTITNGAVQFVGDVGHVSCNPPYILDSKRVASYNCSSLPEFSKMPLCILPLQCAAFPIANAIWPGGFEGYQNNTEVSISCEHSYRLDGQGQMTCHDGRWISQSYPRCLPTSCASYPVANGNVTVISANNRSIATGQHDENTTAAVVCNRGYHLVGAETIICQNRQWLPSNGESSLPFCLSSSRLAGVCPPYHIDNGHVIRFDTTDSHRIPGKYSVGDQLAVVCNVGYILDEKRQNQDQLSSTSASVSCEKTGRWTYDNSSTQNMTKSGVTPRCVIFGCPPLHIANSNVSGHFDGPNGYHVSVQSVGVICNPGYQLRGKHQIKCNPYTQKWASDSSSDFAGPDWRHDFPVCIPDSCAHLVVRNGRIRFRQSGDESTGQPRNHPFIVHAANVTAEVICKEDYELLGARLLICADGEWVPADGGGGGHASSICAKRSHKHSVWLTLFAVLCALAVVVLVGFVVYRRVLRNNQQPPDRLRLSRTPNESFQQLQDEL